MKNILIILGSERYTEDQIKDAVKIAQTGDFIEVFAPTPDGNSRLSGKILHTPRLTTFKCDTMIVPSGILTKIKEYYRATNKGIHITFCDLVDTWRCEVNRVAARDSGYGCEVLMRGKKIRKMVPAYEYPVK